jgi:hypothetical protein
MHGNTRWNSPVATMTASISLRSSSLRWSCRTGQFPPALALNASALGRLQSHRATISADSGSCCSSSDARPPTPMAPTRIRSFGLVVAGAAHVRRANDAEPSAAALEKMNIRRLVRLVDGFVDVIVSSNLMRDARTAFSLRERIDSIGLEYNTPNNRCGRAAFARPCSTAGNCLKVQGRRTKPDSLRVREVLAKSSKLAQSASFRSRKVTESRRARRTLIPCHTSVLRTAMPCCH